MEIALESQEMVAVGPISHRGTLKLLPPGKKSRQKVVVGDDTGCVTALEMKKGAPNTVFKTLATNKEVCSVELGGPVGKKDKVFVSSGQQLRGLSKKGKEFFTFNTNLTETITSMFVEESKIWTAAEYVYNLFDNGRDVNFFMAPDRINDLACLNVTRETEYNALLACQDGFLRLLQGDNPVMETPVGASIVSIMKYQPSASKPGAGAPQQVIFGTRSGVLGQVLLDSKSMRRGWTLSPAAAAAAPAGAGAGAGAGIGDGVAPSGRGPITALANIDFTKDDVRDIVVGRDDGEVSVYSFDISPTPLVQYSTNVGESVRSVGTGQVCNPAYDEMIVGSYSGRVVSYTTEPLAVADTEDTYGRNKGTVQREGRIKSIRKELEQLKAKVQKEQEKLSKYASEFIPMQQQFKVKASFTLEPDEAAYKLAVEIPSNIDVVALQSAIPVDLLDTDTNIAIVSRTKPDRSAGNYLLATYRCQESLNRLEMTVRTVEGQYGDLQALVVAKMEPKTAQMVRVSIKPLSLHHRIHGDIDARPVNTLRITGSFTFGQMHEWVAFCLPDVPARVQDSSLDMSFRNVYLGSVLNCSYSKGDASFRSDSVSTIAILKEVITKQATALKIRVNLSFDIKDETVPNFLKLIHPKLTYTLSLARKVNLIEALKEIKLQENDMGFLAPEYVEVIQNGEKLQREFKNRPRALEMLYGLVTDLFVDKHKFKGHNVQHKIPQLLELLEQYEFDAIVRYFNAPA